MAMTDVLLPCSGCGAELQGSGAQETTVMIDVTPAPVFHGRKGQREVPALECPECGEVTAL